MAVNVGMRLVVTLALAQLRHHRQRWGLLVLGVGLVVLIPVTTAGLSRSVQARTIRQTVASLSLTDSTVLVSQEASSTSRGAAADDDRVVRRELSRLTSQPVLHELLYRSLNAAGSQFTLGGVDSLDANIHLISGRLPRACTATRCEVVRIGGADSPALRHAAGTVGIDVVGVARRRSAYLVTGELDPGRSALLLASGTSGIADLPTLTLFSRHYVWAGAVDADRIVSLGVRAFDATALNIQATLDTELGNASLNAPTDQLAVADSRARASAQRLGLLGGFAAVLLFGFALVAATGLRREAVLFGQILRRRGATGRQITAVTAIEALVACVLGMGVGLSAGAVTVGAVWADGTTLTPTDAAGHALAASIVTAAALSLAASVITGSALLWPDSRARDIWRLVDVIAVAAFGTALLAGYRGSTSAATLADSTDPLVIALPVLTSVVAAAVAARLWAPSARLLDRLLGSRLVATRLALSGSVRRPLRPVVTAAFLAATFAAVVFASTYRATLLANNADQAAFRVPLTATLAPKPGQPTPNVSDHIAGPASQAFGVLRSSVAVPGTAGAATSAALLAPEAAALQHVQRWGRVTGSGTSPAALANELSLTPVSGPTLPAGVRTLSIAATGTDPNTALSMWVRASNGRQGLIAMKIRSGAIVGNVPQLGDGALVVTAFGIDKSFDYASHRAHGLGEGTGDRAALTGRLTLGSITADGQPVPWSWTGWGSALGTVQATTHSLVIAYAIDAATVVTVPNYAELRSLVLPVVVDPATAAAATHAMINLQLDASTTLRARIVATMPRVPTVDGSFALTDLASLQAVLDLTEPGRNPDTYWIDGTPSVSVSSLTASGFRLTQRSSVQASLDADPVGVGTRQLLVLVAALALAGGIVGLVLLVLGERRDGAGELYAWEADGIAPRALRRMLAIRAGSVAVVALPVGVAAGIVLAVTGARLVAVDATGTAPVPPIEVAAGSGTTIVVLAAGLVAGLLAGVAAAAICLRERFPVAAETELR